jgi:methylated-DNA-[protein]-cysteine S-methyltransferase
MPHTLRRPGLQFVFPTPLGWFGLTGSDAGIRFLSFGHASERQVQTALAEATSTNLSGGIDPTVVGELLEQARERLERYAEGEPVDLSAIPVDVPRATGFQRRVIEELKRVGYGESVSYAELAERAGSPGAARAVGNLMARNPVPLIVPCHRVIGSGGRLGGYSAPQGLAMKRRLLDMESLRT